MAAICLGGEDVDKGKGGVDINGEYGEDNDDWHEFSYDENVDGKLTVGKSSREENLQLVVYDSDADGDEEGLLRVKVFALQ